MKRSVLVRAGASLSPKRLAVVAVTGAALVGLSAPAAAAPISDPLAPITEFASRSTVGNIAAPVGLTVQALDAAHNAGFPIMEAVAVQDVPSAPSTGPSAGARNFVEYGRVYDRNRIHVPTRKFVTVGALPLDVFYQRINVPTLDPTIYINPHVGDAGMTVLDPTPVLFRNTPVVTIPDGPPVGAALVTVR
ncbi:hypothetical protein [Rhodococcus marinonascens]|uniref:hypothetical protein n=1 Tax=Rhodococcus marinonascens TaxID=38311 RepID=UPI000A5AACC0|nr:hypothetical protein [Rhodococcus marinonascens]